MTPFTYSRPSDTDEALRSGADLSVAYVGGGTTLLDIMKLGVRRPSHLIDIGDVQPGAPVQAGSEGLRISAFARMTDVAEHEAVGRDYPVLRQSLLLAASPQIRSMARIGGNLLQSTRCPYFRDTSFDACNRRAPGSGCTAIEGENRGHAVLGGSSQCIATYPGDLAQALIALDATLELQGADGVRTIPLAQLHRLPGNTPEIETTLQAGELITQVRVPAGPWTRRSVYIKVRDRASYCFALASAAVALEMDGKRLLGSRIALGGVATVPWRSLVAEAELRGRNFDEAVASRAADAAFAAARAHRDNAFKIELGRQTLVRALMTAAHMDIA